MKKANMVNVAFWLFTLFFSIVNLYAGESSVRYLTDKKLWILETSHTSYVIGINETNYLQNVYWGGKLTSDADLQTAHTAKNYPFENSDNITTEEYPSWGGMRYQ